MHSRIMEYTPTPSILYVVYGETHGRCGGLVFEVQDTGEQRYLLVLCAPSEPRWVRYT